MGFYIVSAVTLTTLMVLLAIAAIHSLDDCEYFVGMVAAFAALVCTFGALYFWICVGDGFETSEVEEVTETTAMIEQSKWSADEIEYITRCVYFEVGTESDTCQKAVASVILNQLNAGYWGNDVIKIVTNPNMYSTASRTISDPLIPDERCRRNVLEILQNGSCLDPRIRYFRADHHFEWQGYVGDFNIGTVYFGHFENENYH